MPVQGVLQRCRPSPLNVVLVLSICFFILQLILSHWTHGLTLLMASHHMLCNIFALGGCIITIKHGAQKPEAKDPEAHDGSLDVVVNLTETEAQTKAKRECREQRLRNTFGWARIDILTMLIGFIVLASLSFSLVTEALRALVHTDRQDTVHLPIPVMMLGFVGLILNGLTYLLIGGYTLHQGSFLNLTPGGPMSEESEAEVASVYFATKRQGAVEMLRDVSSSFFVIVCAATVHVAADEKHTAKYIDPVLSILSCVLLVSLSYPYMKESCLILLQTIPGSIDLAIFERSLETKFPEIISYHDLHIWQLAAHRYVATIHIQFRDPLPLPLYLKTVDQLRTYFHEQGIGAVTIQPEFYPSTNKDAPASLECLMQCQAAECIEKVCCSDSRPALREIYDDTQCI